MCSVVVARAIASVDVSLFRRVLGLDLRSRIYRHAFLVEPALSWLITHYNYLAHPAVGGIGLPV